MLCKYYCLKHFFMAKVIFLWKNNQVFDYTITDARVLICSEWAHYLAWHSVHSPFWNFSGLFCQNIWEPIVSLGHSFRSWHLLRCWSLWLPFLFQERMSCTETFTCILHLLESIWAWSWFPSSNKTTSTLSI